MIDSSLSYGSHGPVDYRGPEDHGPWACRGCEESWPCDTFAAYVDGYGDGREDASKQTMPELFATRLFIAREQRNTYRKELTRLSVDIRRVVELYHHPTEWSAEFQAHLASVEAWGEPTSCVCGRPLDDGGDVCEEADGLLALIGGIA